MVVLSILALAAHCTSGSEYEPPVCSTHLPVVVSIAIDRTGARAYQEADGPASCVSFRPTLGQIKDFVSQAGVVNPQAADATLDRSPCYASGRLRFADGRVAQWHVEQLRVGKLSIAGHPEMLLYCRACRTKPFSW